MTVEKKQTFKATESLINIGRMGGWMVRQVVAFGRKEEESSITPRITRNNYHGLQAGPALGSPRFPPYTTFLALKYVIG